MAVLKFVTKKTTFKESNYSVYLHNTILSKVKRPRVPRCTDIKSLDHMTPSEIT